MADLSHPPVEFALVRAFDLEAADATGFTDIEGNTHEANINALAAADITVGCRQDPLLYCPTRAVTRAQMATFLARALGIVEAPRPEVLLSKCPFSGV